MSIKAYKNEIEVHSPDADTIVLTYTKRRWDEILDRMKQMRDILKDKHEDAFQEIRGLYGQTFRAIRFGIDDE
jgi:hypothetical protein